MKLHKHKVFFEVNKTGFAWLSAKYGKLNIDAKNNHIVLKNYKNHENKRFYFAKEDFPYRSDNAKIEYGSFAILFHTVGIVR